LKILAPSWLGAHHSALVHRKLPLVLILAAWLLATGSQWDLLQTFAWARMLTENVQSLPMEAALARTFSPEGRCEMCNGITTAKQQQDEADSALGGKAGGKTLLVYMPTPVVVIQAPNVSRFIPSETLITGLGRSAPPLPPPRV